LKIDAPIGIWQYISSFIIIIYMKAAHIYQK
jgi:hypothetical protein